MYDDNNNIDYANPDFFYNEDSNNNNNNKIYNNNNISNNINKINNSNNTNNNNNTPLLDVRKVYVTMNERTLIPSTSTFVNSTTASFTFIEDFSNLREGSIVCKLNNTRGGGGGGAGGGGGGEGGGGGRGRGRGRGETFLTLVSPVLTPLGWLFSYPFILSFIHSIL